MYTKLTFQNRTGLKIVKLQIYCCQKSHFVHTRYFQYINYELRCIEGHIRSPLYVIERLYAFLSFLLYILISSNLFTTLTYVFMDIFCTCFVYFSLCLFLRCPLCLFLYCSLNLFIISCLCLNL